MEIDTITLGGTDYEDMLMRDATDTMSSDDGAGAGVGGDEPADAGGLAGLAYYYNYSTLVSEAWESARVRTPGVQLHEACVLLLSALVVGVHGLLGLLPRSLLTARAAWLLLHAGLGLGCLYGLACLFVAVHNALCRRLFRDDDDDDDDADDEDGEEEEDGDAEVVEGKEGGPSSLEQSAEGELPAVAMESIMSAQLEKEHRVQRWIDNLVPDREQVNLEACGEIKGRNMEAETSSADLLGDGQPSATTMAPRCPRLLPLPPLPPLASAEATTMTKEGRRALSLAYELSLAVRQQTAGDIRATLSAPEGRLGHLQSVPPTLSALSTLSEHRDAWMLVRRGKEALDEPILPHQGRSVPVTIALPAAAPTPAPAAAPEPLKESSASEAVWQRQRLAAESQAPRSDTSLGTPVAETEAPEAPEVLEVPATPGADSDSTPPTPPNPSAPLNASSSLLSFVRRFSGTRFLLRELANATAEGLSLRLRDSRPLPLPLPLQIEARPGGIQDPDPQRSVLALPRVDAMQGLQGAAQGPRPVRRAEAETSVTPERIPPLLHRERSNVMKVFSKGILSEGSSTVDISTTSIQATAAIEASGAPSLLAQEAAGLLRAPTRTTTATTATCTTESDGCDNLKENAVAAPVLARSTLNLSSLGARAREPADPQDFLCTPQPQPLPVTVTTSRGLTANMSEEGIPRPAPSPRFADLDDEHKSLFDMKKSLLTSIPEAAPPDEDTSHYF